MKLVRPGTRWWDGTNKRFLVLAVVETDDGHTWVHYREDKGIKTPATDCKEYSCYIESFEQRFRSLPE